MTVVVTITWDASEIAAIPGAPDRRVVLLDREGGEIADMRATNTIRMLRTITTSSLVEDFLIHVGEAAPVPPPTAVIVASATADEGDEITFDGLQSTPAEGATTITAFQWRFGDETTDTGPIVSHIYGDNGRYDVSLTVTDDQGGTATATHAITINNVAPTITDISADPNPLSHIGGTTTITVTAIDPAGAADPLHYWYDCDGNQAFESGPHPTNSAACTFTEADRRANTVNVLVDDQDGASPPIQPR